MLSILSGLEVPIPTFPVFLSTQKRGEDEPIAKNGDEVATFPLTELYGVEDPIYSVPAIDDVPVGELNTNPYAVVERGGIELQALSRAFRRAR